MIFVFQPGDESGVKLQFQLSGQSKGEAQLVLLISDVTFAQKLRGTLTYMMESAAGTVQEKIDFILPLMCSNFIIGRLSHRDNLTELLKSGQLACKIKREVPNCHDFDKALKCICNKAHLVLVEQVGDTASLYGHSLKDHHVCLLLKLNVSICIV